MIWSSCTSHHFSHYWNSIIITNFWSRKTRPLSGEVDCETIIVTCGYNPEVANKANMQTKTRSRATLTRDNIFFSFALLFPQFLPLLIYFPLFPSRLSYSFAFHTYYPPTTGRRGKWRAKLAEPVILLLLYGNIRASGYHRKSYQCFQLAQYTRAGFVNCLAFSSLEYNSNRIRSTPLLNNGPTDRAKALCSKPPPWLGQS